MKNLDIRIEHLRDLFPIEECIPAVKLLYEPIVESGAGMVCWTDLPEGLDYVDEEKIQGLEVNYLMNLLPGFLLGLIENRNDRSQVLAYKLVLKLKSDASSGDYGKFFSDTQFNFIVKMFDRLLTTVELFDDYEHIWLFRTGFTTIDPENYSL